MNISSKDGVTMISLTIYVISFVIIVGIIGTITMFFYNNINLLNNQTYSASEYNKFNMYLVNESKEEGNYLIDFDDSDTFYTLTFSNGNTYTLDTDTNLLYFNKSCLCEDVQDLNVDTDFSTGKEVIKVKIDFSNVSYTTSYTMSI